MENATSVAVPAAGTGPHLSQGTQWGGGCGVPTSTEAVTAARVRGVECRSAVALDGATASPGGQGGHGGHQEDCVTHRWPPQTPHPRAVSSLEGSNPPHTGRPLPRRTRPGSHLLLACCWTIFPGDTPGVARCWGGKHSPGSCGGPSTGDALGVLGEPSWERWRGREQERWPGL